MEQITIFDNRPEVAPLASRLRPETLDEYVGQQHLIGKGKILMDGTLEDIRRGGDNIDETVAELYRSLDI